MKFLSAVEQTVERISTHPEAGAPLAGEFRKRIVPGFPYNIIYRVGKIILTLLLWLTIVVGQVIGANEPIVANHRVEKDASDRASHRSVRPYELSAQSLLDASLPVGPASRMRTASSR